MLGFAGLAGYVVHARRHPQPLLDLKLFHLPTYRAGVAGGSLFRIGIGASPFLLPLMLQLGFGLSPVQSGLLTFTSAIGAIFMKTLAARVLKRFGFRRVLVLNALVASAMLCGVRAVPPGHAARADSRGAAGQRLLSLAAVHEPERDQLRRSRLAADGAGEQHGGHGAAAVVEPRRRDRRLLPRDRGRG